MRALTLTQAAIVDDPARAVPLLPNHTVSRGDMEKGTLIILNGGSSAGKTQQAGVNSDNLNQMIAAAKTPGDHEAIAAYYNHEAAENEKLLALSLVNRATVWRGSAGVPKLPDLSAERSAT